MAQHRKTDPLVAPTGDRPILLWLQAALLVAVVFASLWPGMYGEYIWDDSRYLTANPNVRAVDGLWTIWFAPLTQYQTHYYPLALSSFWVEFHTWGLWPFGHHMVNATLHALCAVLLWLVLRRLAVPGAFVAAAIFALHPMQAESVAWISERKNVLCGSFYMLAALAWLRYTETSHWRPYVLTLLAFALAMLSKTMACTFPVAVLVVAWWREPERWKERIAATLPFFAISLVMGILTSWRESDFGDTFGSMPHFSLLERTLIAGRAFWFYPAKLLWPTHLTTIYPRWPVDPADPTQWLFLLAAAAIVPVLWALRGRLGRGPAAAVFFYGVTIAPSLGLISYITMYTLFVADHFVYLACIGIIVLACAAAIRGLERLGAAARPVKWIAATGVLSLLFLLMLQQSAIYATRETLWADSVRKEPDNWFAQYDLGTFYAEHNRVDEAIEHLSAAVRLHPVHAMAQHNLGMMLAARGRLEEGIAHLEESVRLEPRWAQAYTTLGSLYSQAGQMQAAEQNFARAVELNPKNIDARVNLGVTLRRLGRNDEAIEQLQIALEQKPDHAIARVNLQRAIDAKGNQS